MKVLLAILLCVWGAVPIAVAQMPLRTQAKGPVRIGVSYILPAKIDSSSNLYIRLCNNGVPGPFLKFPYDGSAPVQFDTSAVPGSSGVIEFTPTDSGDVYVLLHRAPKVGTLLARFNGNGALLESHELDSLIWPRNIAAFSDGNLLMVFQDRRKDFNHPQQSVGIFSSSGKWLREVRLSEAENRTSSSGVGQTTTGNAKPHGLVQEAISGPDGNVYFRQPDPPAVFQITPAGHVARYDLTYPAGQVNVRSAVIGNGRMVVQYDTFEQDKVEPRRFLITGNVCEIVDLATGKTLKFFRNPPLATVIGELLGLREDSLLYLVTRDPQPKLKEVPLP